MYMVVHFGGITITITLNVLVYHGEKQFEDYGKYQARVQGGGASKKKGHQGKY